MWFILIILMVLIPILELLIEKLIDRLKPKKKAVSTKKTIYFSPAYSTTSLWDENDRNMLYGEINLSSNLVIELEKLDRLVLDMFDNNIEEKENTLLQQIYDKSLELSDKITTEIGDHYNLIVDLEWIIDKLKDEKYDRKEIYYND